MKYLIYLSRIVVGNLFIFSGIVKANDPLGFSYKLEEYFVEFGMDWSWLHDILVPLAAALCIFEIVLGVAVLVGYRMKIVSWLLLKMIVFFTILTFASAVFEIVRSCGCFGDAIPLNPWQSFYKDLILLFFILILFIKRKTIEPINKLSEYGVVLGVSAIIMLLLSNMLDWYSPLIQTVLYLGVGFLLLSVLKKEKKAAQIATVLSLVYSVIFSIIAVYYLPFKDFRPYANSKSIPEQMVLPEGAKPPVYETVLSYKNKKTGEVKDFSSEEYSKLKIWEDKNWEWSDTKNKLIEEGDEAKITDFSITNHDSEEITDRILAEEKLLLIVSYDMSLANESHLSQINKLCNEAKSKGIKVIGLSSAGMEQKDKFIKKNQLDFDFLITDGIVLKTMIRSNPGVMYLENGFVKGKYHHNKLPTLEEVLTNKKQH